MEYNIVEARCLFCEVTVRANQKSLAGQWESPEDMGPRWLLVKRRSGRHWLWYVYSDYHGNLQDFYLCPRHNDPHCFHAAMIWAETQLEEPANVDFTGRLAAPILCPESVEKWDRSANSLSKGVPDLSQSGNQPTFPNNWQVLDPRLDGCLEIANDITDIFDDSCGLLLSFFKLPLLPQPLELAEAMKKAATRIECLTRK